MGEKKKLMIVDDSSIIRKVIQNYLAQHNLEIVGMAADGKEALQMFEDKKPDLVTLDITMPEMDGLTVLEKMRQKHPEAKIVIITALSDKATGLRAIKLGAKAFIPKPFTEDKLKSVLSKFLN